MDSKRQRRLIFNDDSEELAHARANTVEGFLDIRLRSLVGTQVDTIAWSVLGICGDAPAYDSQVQPVFGAAHGGTPPGYPHYVSNIESLIASGNCPLRIVTEFAHQNGMEAFASVRMNDVHDSFIEGMKTLWKREHPEFLVDTSDRLEDRGVYVTSQDFTHPAVRDRKFEIIEEVCERYDIDGVELDYIRHPVLFSRSMRGLPATGGEVGIMTSLMRRVRRRMNEIAARRRRPLLLAVRVPESFKLSMNIGLDLETWLKEDLVDILIAGGGYTPFTLPLAALTRAAREYGVQVYPCINAGIAMTLSDGAFMETTRALAMKWYHEGADGVYLWNLATPFLRMDGEALRSKREQLYACLTEIGDRQTILQRDKLYAADGPAMTHYAFISSTPPLPLSLGTNEVQRVSLVIGDDVEAAVRSGSLKRLELRFQFRGEIAEDSPVLRLNGSPLGRGEIMRTGAQHEYAVTYSPRASQLSVGENVIEASLTGGGSATASPVELQRMHLWIRYL